MHITPGLQRKLTRLRYHIVADRIELKLTRRDPSSCARERELLALFIDVRQTLLDWACGELDALKANFNPGQPRIPAGQPGAGQWTSGGGGSGAIIGFTPDGTPIEAVAQPGDNLPPGSGHNGGPPLDPPPQIPEQQPPDGKTGTAKSIARWLAATKQIRNAKVRAMVAALDLAIRSTGWLDSELASIDTYQDPPKSLEELQNAVGEPRAGTDIHHVMEKGALSNAGYDDSVINAPANLVRIPRYKHQEITAWYATKNPEFGDVPPRTFLADKPLEMHLQLGLKMLRDRGVMKP